MLVVLTIMLTESEVNIPWLSVTVRVQAKVVSRETEGAIYTGLNTLFLNSVPPLQVQ